MEKVRVLIATGTMNAGGAETLIMEMLRHKSNAIEYVLLIHYVGSIAPGIYDEEIKRLGIPIIYIRSVGSVGEREYTRTFVERVKEIGKVDILHSHLNAVGGIIAKAAKKAGIKNRIIHCHADITYTGGKVSVFLSELKLAVMKNYVNQYGTDYWACSEPAGKRLYYKNKSVMIIPNVIDVEKYLAAEDKRVAAREKIGFRNSFILGSVGRIAPIKNYELAIKTVAELYRRGRSAEYVCYGRIVDESYYESLLDLTKELKVDSHIHFLGNSTEVQNDIAAFDVFLMPSISEGFGMAAIEAQAEGIPALVSTGVPDAVDVGLNLIRFLEPIEEKWADAIMEIEETKHPDNAAIINAFDRRRLNSATVVAEIESEYIKIAGKG